MAEKQSLQELLKHDQEPFHLESYISHRLSQLKSPSPNPPITSSKLRKPNPIGTSSPKPGASTANLHSYHACFFAFQKDSPFRDLPSPAASEMSPCKSPAAVLLRVPPGTAELLIEAAARIQRRRKSRTGIDAVGLGIFGSFLKKLRDRTKRKHAIGGDNNFRISRTCGSDVVEDEIVNGDFGLPEARFCSSPSSSGRRSPGFCTPAPASPCRRVLQEKENYTAEDNSHNVNGVEGEKEQCSPVSVLDSFFEDDENKSVEGKEEDDDDVDLGCSYANVQRVKQQLLDRLRRFEKLAELDPLELEKTLLDDSDDEMYERISESAVSEDDDNEPSLSLHRKQSVDRFLNEAFCSTRKMHLVLDPLVERKKSKIICPQLDTVDTMAELLDLEIGYRGLGEFPEEMEEISEGVELAILGQLVEELSEEFV